MQELQPQLAVALLALPLESAEQRSRGLAVAEKLLLGVGAAPAEKATLSAAGGPYHHAAARDELAGRLAGCLTAAEQVGSW